LDLECSARDSDYFEQGLEPYHTDHCAHHKPALSRFRDTERIRPGRHQPQCVPLTGEFWQTDLGRWTDDDVSDGDRVAVRQWQVERRTVPRSACHAGHWVIGAL
jgi:hypothetical protein